MKGSKAGIIVPTLTGPRREVQCFLKIGILANHRLDTVTALVLTIHVFSQFKQNCLLPSFAAVLWSHSLRVGVFAERAVQIEGKGPELSKDAFTSGLLHDVGHLMMAANLPQQYNRMLTLAQGGGLSHDEAERQVFGATHAEVGAYLLGLWGLPNSIVEAVAYHDRPDDCLVQGFIPLTVVHVGDALDSETQDTSSERNTTNLNMNYLANLGLADRLSAWRQLYSSTDEKKKRGPQDAAGAGKP